MKLRSRFIYVLETFLRWISVPIEPGLIEVGNPDENSPVLVTCNYDLTVRRVLKHLKNMDCYLLIAPSNGINVWCASCGGDFDEHSVITAIKLTNISEKVKHRTLILPQLSAPGVDVEKIYEETGWRAVFGPVYAKDIPKYVQNGFKKTREMSLVKFGIKSRIEMASIYFFTITLILLPIFALITFLLPNMIASPLTWILKLISFSALMIYGMYLFLPSLPIKSGLKRVAIWEILILIILFSAAIIKGNIFTYIDLLVTSLLMSVLVGFDFNGTLPTEKSGLGEWFYKRGSKEMKFLTGTYKLTTYGVINMQREKCINCGLCIEVCPRGVYVEENGEILLAHGEKCVNCSACVKQCPVKCLEILSW